MYFRTKKQIFFWFVLPVAILILTTSVLLFLDSLIGFRALLSFLALTILWITWGYILSGRFSRPIRELDKLIKDTNNPSLPGVTHPADQSFNDLPVLFSQAVNRIKELETDLRALKFNRLRSVIDGQDHERQRLARELHDGVGQALIAVRLGLENAGSLSYSQMRASVDVCKEMVDRSIEEIRNVTNSLIPSSLAEFGVIAALRARCEEMAAVAGMQVEFYGNGSLDRLEKKSLIYLYRIAQEAINNAVKHSRASKVRVSLSRINDVVCLEVTDDGKGFDLNPMMISVGNGILNMRERTEILGGTFQIESSSGSGTRIKVQLPYKTRNGNDTDHYGR